MKYRLLAFVLLCCFSPFASAQWSNLNSPTNINLLSTQFLNYDTGYAVGGNLNSSIFIKTTDGGANWTLITNTQTKWLYDVVFFNDSIGLACGFEGAMYKTQNAGISWEAKPSETTAALYSMSVKPDGTIYAVGQDGVMIKSTNMGDNWDFVTSNTSQTMLDIMFYDDSFATAAGYQGEMIYTTDGGNNWAVRLLGTTQSVTGLWMLSPDTIWFTTTAGRIYKTNNAGQSFYYLTPTSNDLNAVVFTDKLNGYIVGHQRIFQTINGGLNWIEMTPYPTLNGMKDIHVSADDRVMYAVGDNGSILKNVNTIGLETDEPSHLMFYPNPAQNAIRVNVQGDFSITVVDVNGRIYKLNNNFGMVDVSQLDNGMYSIVVETLEGVLTTKLIIDR